MIDLIKKYIENKIQLVKLELISVSANLAAKMVSSLVVVLLATIILFMFSIALAFGIGQYFNNNIALGFVIVGGGYLLFFIIYIIFAKDSVGRKVKDYVVKTAMEAQDDLTND